MRYWLCVNVKFSVHAGFEIFDLRLEYFFPILPFSLNPSSFHCVKADAVPMYLFSIKFPS